MFKNLDTISLITIKETKIIYAFSSKLVQYYAACYDIRIKTMFGSSLPPVVCSKAHALVTYIDYVSNMAGVL
jgi:hypothetical protein